MGVGREGQQTSSWRRRWGVGALPLKTAVSIVSSPSLSLSLLLWVIKKLSRSLIRGRDGEEGEQLALFYLFLGFLFTGTAP